MSRLSFRPRPLDIHKKIPIVKSIKEFEDDDTPTGTRNSQILRISADAEDEVHHARTKRTVSEIPIPEFVIVDTYERDYLRIFAQPNSYIHARGVRSEIGEFVEYDLDNEDEDWLARFNEDNMTLAPEKLEYILFKLEVLDLKARERAGVMAPTFGSPVPVILQFHVAAEALQAISVKYSVLESAYDYWKGKRERWQKPILRRLQPPPPVNDTNPYNVFRPREKAHRLHTRRMQRRENNVQSFEKLRQVRRSLDQAKTILEALIKREEKKREFMETEVCIQRVQIKYKDETEHLEDSYLLPSLSSFSQKFGSSEDEFMDSEDVGNNNAMPSRYGSNNQYFADTKPVMVSAPNMRWRSAQSWLNRLDPMEPIMPFTKPLIPEKLAAAGIVPPRVEDCTPREEDNDNNAPSFRSSHGFRGRIGRGGRIIFDRWNPLSHTPVNCGDSMYISSRNRPSSQFM